MSKKNKKVIFKINLGVPVKNTKKPVPPQATELKKIIEDKMEKARGSK